MNAAQFGQAMGALPLPRTWPASAPQVSAPPSPPPPMPPRMLPPGNDVKRVSDTLNLYANGIDMGMKDLRLLASQIRLMCDSAKATGGDNRGEEISIIETFAACCLATVENINFNTAGLYRVWHDLRKLSGAK